MKRGAPDHWKMMELARLMKVPQQYALPWANGIMERLWHYTARYHPQGDIGTAPDWKIAEACGWPIAKRNGRPGIDLPQCCRLIDALVTVGWLDRDAVLPVGCRSYAGGLPVPCRLLVHDWAEHCTEDVKRSLKRLGLPIFFPTIPETGNTKSPPALALALPIPIPLPHAGRFLPTNANPSAEDLREITDGYDRHLKHSGKESQQMVIQIVLSMNGQFDWVKFRSNHAGYCAHYAAHGWDYCTLSFLAWIRAGMPAAPPPKGQVKPAEKPYGCPVCKINPCACFARYEKTLKLEEEANAQNAPRSGV